MHGKGITRKKWLSIALGLGLAVTSLGTVSAQQQTTTTQSTTSDQQAYNQFLERTAREWSSEGYSSAEHMRQVEGGEWYAEMRDRFGGSATMAGTSTGSSTDANNQVEQNGRAFGGSFGEGQLEDDEANGSVITGNDAQGGDDDDDDDEENEEADDNHDNDDEDDDDQDDQDDEDGES